MCWKVETVPDVGFNLPISLFNLHLDRREGKDGRGGGLRIKVFWFPRKISNLTGERRRKKRSPTKSMAFLSSAVKIPNQFFPPSFLSFPIFETERKKKRELSKIRHRDKTLVGATGSSHHPPLDS